MNYFKTTWQTEIYIIIYLSIYLHKKIYKNANVANFVYYQ